MLTFKQLDELVDLVEELLRRYNITISPGSLLEQSCLEIRADYEKHRDPSLVDGSLDFRPAGREVSGASVLFQRLVRADSRRCLCPAFVRHLQLIGNSIISQASVYSDHHLTETAKQSSDKVFELVVGLAAAEVGSEVMLENPRGSGGDNPDVLITISDVRWGFPCKVMTSTNLRTLFDRIEEGVAQLERSAAERGCVVVNLRNLFDHDLLNPTYDHRVYPQEMGIQYVAWSDRQVDAIASKWMGDLIKRFVAENDANAIQALFSKPKTTYGFVGYLETAAVVRKAPGIFMPAPLSYCFYLRPSKLWYEPLSEVQALCMALAGPNSKKSPTR
jgi:hypothetical protein